MLIGLCGTQHSGKTTIAEFLVSELGFYYLSSSSMYIASLSSSCDTKNTANGDEKEIDSNQNSGFPIPSKKVISESWRSNINIVIDNVTPTDEKLPEILRRPYFLLIHVDAPLQRRYLRASSATGMQPCDVMPLSTYSHIDEILHHGSTPDAPGHDPERIAMVTTRNDAGDPFGNSDISNRFENMLRQSHDVDVYTSTSADGRQENVHQEMNGATDLMHNNNNSNNIDSDAVAEAAAAIDHRYVDDVNHSSFEKSSYQLNDLERMSHLQIYNDYCSKGEFLHNLRLFNIPKRGRAKLRPSWDVYFMSLATLASKRTNCMKRHVGCVIARDRRIISSGYNGTPSRVTNCFDGGCPRCNGSGTLDLCLCLHAEENAIIEAGRERCNNSTLYTTVFPCILCAKKIVQAGISRVVYDEHYSKDDMNSEMLLKAGTIIIDKVESFSSRMAPRKPFLSS